MKIFLILFVCATASAQFFGFNRQPFFRGQPRRQQFNRIQTGGAPIDDSLGNSDYHYSWRHAGFHTKWEWGGAVAYCRSLGQGWGPISINDQRENSLVVNAIGRENVPYIWTGGRLSRNGWGWPSGPFVNIGAWSHTGFHRRPQPDNRDGNEVCLAVLNNVYRDGIKWHDVECHHTKPIICERTKGF